MRTISVSIGFAALCISVVNSGTADDKKPNLGHHEAPYDFKAVRTLEDSKEVTELAFSPNGQVLAGAINNQDGSAGHVEFWNPVSGKKIEFAFPNLKLAKERASIISNLAFLDDKTVAAGCGTSVVRMWSYPKGQELPSLDFKRKVERWAIAPGLIAVATCEGGPAVILASGPPWNVKWLTDYNGMPGQPFLPISIALSHDQTKVAVATGTSDSEIGIFAVKDGQPLRTVEQRTLGLLRPWIAYSPMARDFAVVSGRIRINMGRYASVQIWNHDVSARKSQTGWGDIHDPNEAASCAYGCLFTPDGNTVVVPCEGGTVRLYEANTGGLRQAARVPDPASFALSPDGRLLAILTKDGVTLFDWRAHTREKVEISDTGKLNQFWDDLAGLDSSLAYQSMLALESSPKNAVRMIGEKLKPVAVPKAETIRKLIANLGSDDFQTREEATKELGILGDAVKKELLEATQSDAPEIRNRANGLLVLLGPRNHPNQLRDLRAAEVLEHINTPESQELLKRLASGAAAARLTVDSNAALERLTALKQKHLPLRP